MSRRREEQDIIDKTILEMLSRRHVHWADLEKKVLATCWLFVTSPRFDRRLRYLLKKGYVERVSRGVYRITEKGKKYMEII